MHPILLHIYGPFNINSFSIAIALGLFVGLQCMRKKAIEKGINSQDFTSGFIECALVGILGGRLLHIISEWHNYTSVWQMLSIWNGGMSVLGSFLAVFIYASWYVKSKNIPLLPAFDCVALYGPLIQSIARIGCFLAGCCHGQPTTVPWAVTYTNEEIVAPLYIPLHPTQLYSSLTLFAIFLFLHFRQKRYSQPGEITMLYLMLSSVERWSIDFLRGDRIMSSPCSFIPSSWFSFDQWVALGIFFASFIGFLVIRLRSKSFLGAYEHL